MLKKILVWRATDYEMALQLKKYGPDILSEVPMSDLIMSDIGLAPGDALRLKCSSADWWNYTAKRQRKEEVSMPPYNWDEYPAGMADQTSPDKNPVKYELSFPDGGAQQYYGPHIQPGGGDAFSKSITYFCEARQDWFPIPPGFSAPCPSGGFDDPFTCS